MLGGGTPVAVSATGTVKKAVNSMGGHQEKGRGQVASRPSLAAGEGSVPVEPLAEYSQSLQGTVLC